MCGLVGNLDFELQVDEMKSLLSRQLQCFPYRGPDGSGTYVRPGIGFGHLRLSIIDMDSGQQPMSLAASGSTDPRYTIVFNGEIYNYIELRDELEAQGAQFKTHSDTEVLLHGYELWGKSLPKRLNGMFAFAVHDALKGTLFLSRDPYGQKPLFYLHRGRRLSFSSEVSALVQTPGFDSSISRDSILQYLAFEQLQGDRSIYSGVKKLLPGHSLFFEGDRLTLERYHHSVPTSGTTRFEDALEQTDAALREAVHIACRSDVPVGMLLSGGLDSSLVLAYYREIYPQRKIDAFHIEVDDPTYNESAYARQVSKHLNVDLHIEKLDLKRLGRLASELPARFDEPQADPGILPKYLVCENTSKTNKVALTGDGGDEFFYGYLIMKAQKLSRFYEWIPNWMHKGLIQPTVLSLPSSQGYMAKDFLAKRFMQGFPGTSAERTFNWMSSYGKSELKALVKNADIDSGLLRYPEQLYTEAKNSPHMGKFAYYLQKTFLPDYVLCNSDRASMLHSLELRSPLLDTRLTSLLNTFNDSYKMHGFTTKHLMKKIAERHLPREIIYRKKIGFTVPIGELIRHDLRDQIETLFSESAIRQQGLFEHAPIRKMLDLHLSGKANLYKPIWTLFTLQKWLAHHPATIR